MRSSVVDIFRTSLNFHEDTLLLPHDLIKGTREKQFQLCLVCRLKV